MSKDELTIWMIFSFVISVFMDVLSSEMGKMRSLAPAIRLSRIITAYPQMRQQARQHSVSSAQRHNTLNIGL
jgi:hypothetical protein